MNIKKWVFEKCDKGEYISDQAICDFTESENKFYIVREYTRQWERLEKQKIDFKYIKENRNFTLNHIRRKYLVRENDWEDNLWQPITKEYFDYLNKILNEE
jgi:hypothetical protein